MSRNLGVLGGGTTAILDSIRKPSSIARHSREGYIVSELMRHDACREAEVAADLMQVSAEVAQQHTSTSRPRQEPLISRQRIEGTEEAQALNQVTDEAVDRDHAFGFEFAQRDMDGPLVGTGGAQAVIGQVDALADAHAGVAQQEEEVSAQVIAAQELLLKKLVLLGGKRSGEPLRSPGDVLATQHVRQLRELLGPGQFVEDGAQRDQPVDVGGGAQGRSARLQVGHPAEDMGIALELIEALDMGMVITEIEKEVAHCAFVVAGCVVTQCGTKGVHGTVHHWSQRMTDERKAHHGSVPAGGRRHCATARVYSR